MPRRKRVLVWVGLLVVLALAGLFVVRWVAPPAPGVTWSNFQLIEIGMPQSEVERLLGGPGWSFGQPHGYWSSNAGLIVVCFDGKDRATEKEWTPGDESFLDRLRHWLGF
jgi:hypothetical protein